MSLHIWKRIARTPDGLPLGLCILVQGLLFAVVIPLLPVLISDRIGLDKLEVMAFFIITTLVGMGATLGTGYLSDGSIARHKLVVVCGAVAALGYLGVAAATRPIHVFIAGVATVGFHILFPQLFAVVRVGIVGDWEREAQVIGITALRTLFSFGFILGTGLASWLAQAVDIQAVFYLVAGAVFVLSAYAARVLYRIEGHITQQAARAVDTTGSVPAQSRRASLPVHALIVPLIALIVLQGADGTRRVYLPLVIFQVFHDASIAPLMFGITAAVELVTMGLLGYLASKIGEKYTISIGALAGACSFFILSSAQSLPPLYAASVLYAVFNAALLGVAMAYFQGLLSHRAGLGGSLYAAIFSVGSLVGIFAPLLVPGFDPAIFRIAAILCLAGAALLVIGDRTTQTAKQSREAAMAATVGTDGDT
jgi:SET family sugar efflux transporter-like MFS transporter